MEYTMEELLPVVGRLAKQYTAGDSTSVTYEKAERLMEAVLYCIHEREVWGANALSFAERIGVKEAYQTGYACVEAKTGKALEMYNELLPAFISYGNSVLYEDVMKKLPHFFNWYDVKFEPQTTIVDLDYPVFKDLSGFTGIDKVYEFIRCVRAEQIFLRLFPEEYVLSTVKREESYDNVCEKVLLDVTVHGLLRMPLGDMPEESSYDRLRIRLVEVEIENLHTQIKRIVETVLEKLPVEAGDFSKDGELAAYLFSPLKEFAVRLKNAAIYDTLNHIV